jgi:hypothetical protein
MAFDRKRDLVEVGVGWEKTTTKADGTKNRFFTLRFKVPIMADESVMVFKQSDEMLKKRFKRELTERDPRLIIMRANTPYENKT